MGWQKDLKFGLTLCFDVSVGGDRAPINFYPCHGGQGNQLWRYQEVTTFTYNLLLKNLLFNILFGYLQSTQRIVHVSSKRCLTIEDKEVFVSACTANSSKTQKWMIENVNQKALANWEEM